MTDISELGLSPEDDVVVDPNAPEPGSAFPPQLDAGQTLDFRFTLPDAEGYGFEAKEIKGSKYLQVTYAAVTDKDGDEVTVGYQRATAYRSDKMKRAGMNSAISELLLALAIQPTPNVEGKVTPQSVADALNDANAKGKHFHGETSWRFYCDHKNTPHAEDDAITISTSARKTDIKWPQTAEGTFELRVKCPVCGREDYGQLDIRPKRAHAQSGQPVNGTAAAVPTGAPF